MRSLFGPRSGISLVQVMIAAVAVAGLGVLVSVMMNNLNKTQSTVRLSNIATDLESRHRAATLSSRALSNSRTSPNNSALATCFTTGCPLNTPAAFELVDSAGSILVPKAQPAYVNDAGNVCTPAATDLSCQWQVTAVYTPKCSGACTTPSSYDLKMTISWAKPPGSTQNFIMRPKEIQTAVAKEMFAPPPATTQCDPGQVMTGLNTDGTPTCRPIASSDLSTALLKTAGTCPSGQYLKGFKTSDGTADCAQVQIECTTVAGTTCPGAYPARTGMTTNSSCNAGGGFVTGFVAAPGGYCISASPAGVPVPTTFTATTVSTCCRAR